MSLRKAFAEWESLLRTHLEPGEVVRALGRCADLYEDERDGRPSWPPESVQRGGAGWTYLLVTDRALRWIPNRATHETTLPLASVTAALHARTAHRYAIKLDHEPIEALRHATAHRFGPYRWGNAERVQRLKRTRFAFSRAETEAAIGIREALESRGIVLGDVVALAVPQRSRSGTVLRAAR